MHPFRHSSRVVLLGLCAAAALAAQAQGAVTSQSASPSQGASPSQSASPSQGASPSLALRSLASSCAQCHGTDGRPVAGSIVPALAGLAAPQLVERMTAFKDGTRPATVMAQIARGYSDSQIRELAAYFATQAR